MSEREEFVRYLQFVSVTERKKRNMNNELRAGKQIAKLSYITKFNLNRFSNFE